jgi:hypothetical protein
MDIFLRRTLTGFTPASEADAEAVRGYKVGLCYRAKVVKPRSYEHHKLAFALLTLTFSNLPEKYTGRWASLDSFRYGVAIDAGHCDELVSPNGEIFKVARSISFDALDQVEFQPIFAAMMTVCAAILDMSEPELAGEVSRYADDRYGRIA